MKPSFESEQDDFEHEKVDEIDWKLIYCLIYDLANMPLDSSDSETVIKEISQKNQSDSTRSWLDA